MSRSRNFRPSALSVGISNSAAIAGFQLRTVSSGSTTSTPNGRPSTTPSIGSGRGARSPPSRVISSAVDSLSARSTAGSGRAGTSDVRSKIRHLALSGVNQRERASSDSDLPRKSTPRPRSA